MTKLHVEHGDCLGVMRKLPANWADSVITDPPYGLEFMGKEWDGSDGFLRSLNRDYRTVGTGKLAEPGIGDRDTKWPSNQGWNQWRCAKCGHLPHGGSPCRCEKPEMVRADNRWGLYQQWCEAWAREALRVAKPGAFLLCFGGTRTFHRLACALEDAGWEIRDCMMWMYGTGFPKSHNISKAIDKAARGVPHGGSDPTSPHHGKYKTQATEGSRGEGDKGQGYGAGPGSFMREQGSGGDRELVEDAQQWDGYGTAMKPAYEPIIVAMKPLDGTFAQNALKHGVAGINVDGCRIGVTDSDDIHVKNPNTVGGFAHAGAKVYGGAGSGTPVYNPKAGRWPANVILDEEAGAMLDEQTGERPGCKSPGRKSPAREETRPSSKYRPDQGNYMPQGPIYPDSGGASRFFYCAKASRKERGEANQHPTVKPIALIEYLCKLTMTPKKGRVLDPFCGSGTTGVACAKLGRDFLGIEKDAGYVEVARKRIQEASECAS